MTEKELQKKAIKAWRRVEVLESLYLSAVLRKSKDATKIRRSLENAKLYAFIATEEMHHGYSFYDTATS